MYSYPVWHESCPFTATALFDFLIFEIQVSLATAQSCQENKKTKPFASQCSTCSSSILRPYPNFPPNPICCCLFCFFLPYSHRLSEVSLRPPLVLFGSENNHSISCLSEFAPRMEMVTSRWSLDALGRSSSTKSQIIFSKLTSFARIASTFSAKARSCAGDCGLLHAVLFANIDPICCSGKKQGSGC